MENLASIEGHIVDEHGEAIPGVIVTITPQEGVTREAITTSKGSYYFNDVSMGRCTLKTEMTGFKPYVNNDIEIHQGMNKIATITLQIATVEE